MHSRGSQLPSGSTIKQIASGEGKGKIKAINMLKGIKKLVPYD
jgi:hypothetical protein